MRVSRFMEENGRYPYGEHVMRSKLEVNMAMTLTEFGVAWDYERPTGQDLHYLPDFTILNTPNHLGLGTGGAEWVEVKPQEMLYALRDHCKVEELFPIGEQRVVDITAFDLGQAGVEELWKPKRLAELTGRQVLMCATANRSHTLSVIATETSLVFDRNHPFVCAKGHARRVERARQRQAWREQYERERAQRDAVDAARAADRLKALRHIATEWRESKARYAGRCEACRGEFLAEHLTLMRGPMPQQWAPLCGPCLLELRD